LQWLQARSVVGFSVWGLIVAEQKRVVFVRTSKVVSERIKSRAKGLGLSVNRYCEAAIALELLSRAGDEVLRVARLAALPTNAT
jgi:hypothetical protein